MTDPVANHVLVQILSDPAAVAQLRDALGVPDGRGERTHIQAARDWDVEPATVARWCRQGRVNARKTGRLWIITDDAEMPAREVQPTRRRTPARRTRRAGSQDVRAALRGD